MYFGVRVTSVSLGVGVGCVFLGFSGVICVSLGVLGVTCFLPSSKSTGPQAFFAWGWGWSYLFSPFLQVSGFEGLYSPNISNSISIQTLRSCHSDSDSKYLKSRRSPRVRVRVRRSKFPLYPNQYFTHSKEAILLKVQFSFQ